MQDVIQKGHLRQDGVKKFWSAQDAQSKSEIKRQLANADLAGK